jgi:hypothetical protein
MTVIATQADLAQAFAARGWSVSGGSLAELRMGDRVLVSFLGKRSPVFPFNLSGWITNDAICVAYTVIMHPTRRRAKSVPVVRSGRIDIEKAVASDEDVDRGCAALIDWASDADLNPGIAALLDKDANGSGIMPTYHLAALAATGGVEVLQGYADAFAAGDRLGFVPYITADHITAALAFAKQRRAEPNWLPRSPKMRV